VQTKQTTDKNIEITESFNDIDKESIQSNQDIEETKEAQLQPLTVTINTNKTFTKEHIDLMARLPQELKNNVYSRGGKAVKFIEFTITHYTSLGAENNNFSVTCNGIPLSSFKENELIASNFYKQGTKLWLNEIGTVTIGDRGSSRFSKANRLDLFVPRLKGESNKKYKARVLGMGVKKVKGIVLE
jgi:3D (Asp-Asp-Asp) domain-containing protein